ncbi:TetR/AcrR family transcriptional regulator [Streptomyces sp. AD2-2]|nr:TetR/AcrR family transcriptional regulator [Streptomyces sp. AD2-2]
MRSDVERNRGRILAAARTVFGRDGLSASMASVARETGVGIATVFRHFPTKEALVAAVFTDRMDAYADAVATALDDPDPWHGFTSYIEAACAMQAADNGFADVLTMTFPTAKAMEKRRNEAYEGMVELIGRAKATGRLREDFDPSDLVLLHMANLGVVNACGDAAPDAWRRVVALMIQSFEAPARAPFPPRPRTTTSTGPCSAPCRQATPSRGSPTRTADLPAPHQPGKGDSRVTGSQVESVDEHRHGWFDACAVARRYRPGPSPSPAPFARHAAVPPCRHAAVPPAHRTATSASRKATQAQPGPLPHPPRHHP